MLRISWCMVRRGACACCVLCAVCMLCAAQEWIINRGEEMDPLKVRRLLKDGRCVGPVEDINAMYRIIQIRIYQTR